MTHPDIKRTPKIELPVINPIGRRVVVICSTNFAARSKVESIRRSQGGGVLFVLENGQWLTSSEFKFID